MARWYQSEECRTELVFEGHPVQPELGAVGCFNAQVLSSARSFLITAMMPVHLSKNPCSQFYTIRRKEVDESVL